MSRLMDLPVQRLLLLVSAVVLVDAMFYAALTPLLPGYTERFDLSMAGAGILSGAYAAGALLGTLPSAGLAARAGPRRTLVVGLALTSLASIGFAFGGTIVVLDATRFSMGVGAACSWAGAMGWLIAATPPQQRGATIGFAMTAAGFGFLLGPVLGAIARGTGPELPLTLVALLGVVLGVVACPLDAPKRSGPSRQPLGIAWADSRIRTGAWLVTTVALAFGVVEVLNRSSSTGLGRAAW